MNKYFVATLLILVLAAVFFVLQKNTTRHQAANNSGAISGSTTSEITLSYKISQAPDNHVAIQGYDVYLVSNDETVRNVALDYEGDSLDEVPTGGGLDPSHLDYEGDYELVSAKDGKGISDFALSALLVQPAVNSIDFTDGQPHDGIQKFVDPVTDQEFIKIYQYSTGSSEELFMFRVDDNGQIIPVKFYDEKDNVSDGLGTNYDGSVDSFFDNTKASIGVCGYDNVGQKTYCDEYENKDNNFYLIKSKVSNGMPVSSKIDL